jgi:hypothetical protein
MSAQTAFHPEGRNIIEKGIAERHWRHGFQEENGDKGESKIKNKKAG